jgi:outer membrane protein assembly factor BamE (lipoprotein component of BamABCDE complex)
LISAGLSEARVKFFIGSPLGEEIGPFGEVWNYEPRLVLWPFSRQKTRGLIVTFRSDGKVADAMGSPQAVAQIKLHSGALASEVLKTAGLPVRVEPPYYKKAWYSRQGGKSGRFSLFAVLYDYSGTVVGTQAEGDFD